MSDPVKLGDSFEPAFLRELLAKCEPGFELKPGRDRMCPKCVALVEDIRRAGGFYEPREVSSWVSMGRRYYAGLCGPCGAHEKNKRDAAKKAAKAAEERDEHPTRGPNGRAPYLTTTTKHGGER